MCENLIITGSDFEKRNDSVILKAGETVVPITIYTVTDNVIDAKESFNVTAHLPSHGKNVTAHTRVTIFDSSK